VISINEAVQQGIMRLRMPRWAFPEDHIELSIVNGLLGPWVKLWSPGNEIIGEPNPKDILWVGQNNNEQIYEPYEGPLPEKGADEKGQTE